MHIAFVCIFIKFHSREIYESRRSDGKPLFVYGEERLKMHD